MGSMDDDGVRVDVEEDDRPPVNQNPTVLIQHYSSLLQYIVNYGWYILALLVVFYFIWKRLSPMLDSWRYNSQVSAHKKYDSSEVEKRQLAMEAHRIKLQEEHDKKAAEHAVRQAERDEKKRLDKLEDWERHQAGQGYRSKVKKAEEESSPGTALPKTKKKPRDDGYNPLMGSDRGESSAFRSNRRGPAAGGG